MFFPPIREFIQQSLKTFPWSYGSQNINMAALCDHLIAGRRKSIQSLERTGIDNISARKIRYSLLRSRPYLQILKKDLSKRFSNIDGRERVVVSLDDTSMRRYGKEVHGAAYQHNHVGGGTQFENIIVDCWITSLSYFDYDFKQYLPKKFLQRNQGHLEGFKTKINLAKQLFTKQITQLLLKGARSKQLCCTTDSWYLCEELYKLFGKFKVNYVMGTKKNTQYYLFGKLQTLAKGFASNAKWRFITNPVTKTKIYYQEKEINTLIYGRCKVFAIRQGDSSTIKYYLTNLVKMTIQTFSKRWSDHWEVENLHAKVKKFFGFEDCYSGKEDFNLCYWELSYFLYYLFRLYQEQLRKKGIDYTLLKLWECYCTDYDISKAKKHFYSKSKMKSFKKRILAG
ncbi:hypothetical protein LCGC14_2170360 [marine sediment metagenome]|uniref:Transposase IS4-like domain-containing protein n=1 Tax=marine sediment metagenome TaxID=412755 RepID=A0A0F9GL89_9ZZZZ